MVQVAIITIGTIAMASRKGWGNRCELANICFAVSVCGCCLSAITCVCKVLWCKPLQCWCCDTCGMVLVSLACAPAHKLSCISRCEGAHLYGIFTHNSGRDIHKLRSWTRIGKARQIKKNCGSCFEGYLLKLTSLHHGQKGWSVWAVVHAVFFSVFQSSMILSGSPLEMFEFLFSVFIVVSVTVTNASVSDNYNTNSDWVSLK